MASNYLPITTTLNDTEIREPQVILTLKNGDEFPPFYRQKLKRFQYERKENKPAECIMTFLDLNFYDEIEWYLHLEESYINAQWGYPTALSPKVLLYVAQAVPTFGEDIEMMIKCYDESVNMDSIKKRIWRRSLTEVSQGGRNEFFRISDIVRQIAKEHGLKPEIDDTIPVHTMEQDINAINQDCSDRDFINSKLLRKSQSAATGGNRYVFWVKNNILYFRESGRSAPPVWVFEYRKNSDGMIKQFRPNLQQKKGKRKGSKRKKSIFVDLEKGEAREYGNADGSENDPLNPESPEFFDKKKNTQKILELDKIGVLGANVFGNVMTGNPTGAIGSVVFSDLTFSTLRKTGILSGDLITGAKDKIVDKTWHSLKKIKKIQHSEDKSLVDLSEDFADIVADSGEVVTYSDFIMNDVTEKIESDVEANEAKFKELDATLDIIGFPWIDSDQNLIITNTCTMTNGTYYIETCKHVIDDTDGYICSLNIKRDAEGKQLPKMPKGYSDFEYNLIDKSYQGPEIIEPAKREGWGKPFEGSYPLTSYFGWRVHPISKTVKFHEGVDFGCPNNTPLIAVKDGTIIHSGWISGYGYTVIIDHGGGYQSLYAHMSDVTNDGIKVSAGSRVVKGQVVGLSDNSGGSTGPHLHFAIKKTNESQTYRRGDQTKTTNYVNPLNYIPAS